MNRSETAKPGPVVLQIRVIHLLRGRKQQQTIKTKKKIRAAAGYPIGWGLAYVRKPLKGKKRTALASGCPDPDRPVFFLFFSW